MERMNEVVHEISAFPSDDTDIIQSLVRGQIKTIATLNQVINWINAQERRRGESFFKEEGTLCYEAVFDGSLSDAPFSVKAKNWKYPDKELQAEFYERFHIKPEDRIVVWKKGRRDYYSVTHVRCRSQ